MMQLKANGGNGGRGNASITNRRYNTNPRTSGGRGQMNSASAIYGNNVSRSGSTNYNVYNSAKDYNSKIDAIINYLAEIAGYSEATSNNVRNLQGSGGSVTNVAVQNPNGGFVNKTMVRDPMDIVKSTSKTGIPQLIAKGGIS
jgi:hypothetical protein